MIIGLVCAVLVIGLDQLSKFLVYGSISRSIIGNFLWFESTLNTGVAFSMFEGKSVLFFVLAMIASLAIIYLIWNRRFFMKIIIDSAENIAAMAAQQCSAQLYRL